MKRTFALFCASALLSLALSACGGPEGEPPSAEDPVDRDALVSPEEEASMQGRVAGTLPDSPVLPGGNAAPEAARKHRRSPENGKKFGASYEQMLRNARVHDRDGDLKDHENAVTPGWD